MNLSEPGGVSPRTSSLENRPGADASRLTKGMSLPAQRLVEIQEHVGEHCPGR